MHRRLAFAGLAPGWTIDGDIWQIVLTATSDSCALLDHTNGWVRVANGKSISLTCLIERSIVRRPEETIKVLHKLRRVAKWYHRSRRKLKREEERKTPVEENREEQKNKAPDHRPDVDGWNHQRKGNQSESRPQRTQMQWTNQGNAPRARPQTSTIPTLNSTK